MTTPNGGLPAEIVDDMRSKTIEEFNEVRQRIIEQQINRARG
jgi:hypothetical protein